MDFTDSTVKCFQVSIRLKSEEIIEESMLVSKKKHPSFLNIVSEFHQLTNNTLKTYFMMEIPVESSAEFATDLSTPF